MNAIELRRVTKRFDSAAALSEVTVTVPRNSIVGLIGRNGSGKTTLLRHVTGLLLPDSGDCMTLGVPASKLGRAELERIGVAELQTAVLVTKEAPSPHPRPRVDYVGFETGPEYLFGCGMDYMGRWRHLPSLYAVPAVDAA